MAFIKLFKLLYWCVVCLLYCVTFSQCQLTSVTRNDIDSFRIGDRCKRNASVCSNYEAHCWNNECLCKYDHPHFRNPIIELSKNLTKYQYGSSYGCMTQDMIKHQRIDKPGCMIRPYQSIPHQPTQITAFNRSQKIFQDSCILTEVEVKYPNSNDWRKVPWLNNSFIEFTVLNTVIIVKWKKSVPELQGLMITMWLGCTNDLTSTTTVECLQAKVKGTWTLNSSTVAPPTTVLPTSISTHGGILTQPPATPSTPVTLVKRNAVDAFLVKGGCKGNESLCTNVNASCQQDGWCLCNADNPHFRDPTIKYSGGGSYQNGASYGCISDDLIKHHRINEFMCDITPFQIIPYDENGITTIFISKKGIHFDSCEMIQLEAKFPNDIVRTTNITWVDNTYVQFTPSNSIIYFKWKRSVPKLQGSIITIWLHCYHGVTITNDCLEAKVLGTWPFTVPTTTPPNFTSTGPVQASDNWKNVAIALLVVFPIIVIILIVLFVFCIHRVKRQLGKQRAETSNPFYQGGSAYEYPVPRQYDGISSRGRDNQATTESSYMEPIDPNHNSQSTVDNPSSHYQSLKRDNVNQEEQNTYQGLVKPENQ